MLGFTQGTWDIWHGILGFMQGTRDIWHGILGLTQGTWGVGEWAWVNGRPGIICRLFQTHVASTVGEEEQRPYEAILGEGTSSKLSGNCTRVHAYFVDHR